MGKWLLTRKANDLYNTDSQLREMIELETTALIKKLAARLQENGHASCAMDAEGLAIRLVSLQIGSKSP